jgi:hypothetical protein
MHTKAQFLPDEGGADTASGILCVPRTPYSGQPQIQCSCSELIIITSVHRFVSQICCCHSQISTIYRIKFIVLYTLIILCCSELLLETLLQELVFKKTFTGRGFTAACVTCASSHTLRLWPYMFPCTCVCKCATFNPLQRYFISRGLFFIILDIHICLGETEMQRITGKYLFLALTANGLHSFWTPALHWRERSDSRPNQCTSGEIWDYYCPLRCHNIYWCKSEVEFLYFITFVKDITFNATMAVRR